MNLPILYPYPAGENPPACFNTDVAFPTVDDFPVDARNAVVGHPKHASAAAQATPHPHPYPSGSGENPPACFNTDVASPAGAFPVDASSKVVGYPKHASAAAKATPPDVAATTDGPPAGEFPVDASNAEDDATDHTPSVAVAIAIGNAATVAAQATQQAASYSTPFTTSLRACEFLRLAHFLEGKATLESAFSEVLPFCQRHHPLFRCLDSGLGSAEDFDRTAQAIYQMCSCPTAADFAKLTEDSEYPVLRGVTPFLLTSEKRIS